MSKANPVEKSEIIDPLDIIIGKQIRFRRNLMRMTQANLANKLGISFQQIQKYEIGKNKISASRLFHISEILRTPLYEFYSDENLKMSKKLSMSDQDQEDFLQDDLLSKGETPGLLRAFYDIKDRKKRKMAVDLLKSLHS